MSYEPVIEAFMSRREYFNKFDSCYPYGDNAHYALAFIADIGGASLMRYAWHNMGDDPIAVYMQATDSPQDALIVARLNCLSSKLGMESNAFRMRGIHIYVGKHNPVKLSRWHPIVWRPGMTSIDQLLAYRMMTGEQ